MPATPTLFVATVLGALVIGATAFGINAAVQTPPTLMSADDYSRALRGIEGDARAAMAGCREAAQADREVCRARARADERVRKAELEATYYGTVDAMAGVKVARAKARFEVARARCTGHRGAERLSCLRSARAEPLAPRDPHPDKT